jgi:hypothetical protein
MLRLAYISWYGGQTENNDIEGGVAGLKTGHYSGKSMARGTRRYDEFTRACAARRNRQDAGATSG